MFTTQDLDMAEGDAGVSAGSLGILCLIAGPSSSRLLIGFMVFFS